MSINLGIVLCIECSGIHRSLGLHLFFTLRGRDKKSHKNSRAHLPKGTHISKVRSLSLDRLDLETCRVMLALGNKAATAVFLAGLSPAEQTQRRLPAKAPRQQREAWIAAKYRDRAFIGTAPASPAALVWDTCVCCLKFDPGVLILKECAMQEQSVGAAAEGGDVIGLLRLLVFGASFNGPSHPLLQAAARGMLSSVSSFFFSSPTPF